MHQGSMGLEHWGLQSWGRGGRDREPVPWLDPINWIVRFSAPFEEE